MAGPSGGDGARDRRNGVPGRAAEALSSAESEPVGSTAPTDSKQRSLCAECDGLQTVVAFLGGTSELDKAIKTSSVEPQFYELAVSQRFEQDLPTARPSADSRLAAADNARITRQLVGEELRQSETSLEFSQIAAQ